MRKGLGTEKKRDREVAKQEWRLEKERRKKERLLIKGGEPDPFRALGGCRVGK
jgi:hypothetical protein